MYDHIAREAYKQSPASVVYFIVVASYAYYMKNESLLSDETYDKMCRLVLDRGITHSKLSHLINDDRLRAGSLYDIKDFEYPVWIVRDVDDILRGKFYGNSI